MYWSVDLLTLEQTQASFFPPFPVFVLSYSNQLLVVALYLTDIYVSDIDLLI